MMFKDVYQRGKPLVKKSIFHKTGEELREFNKENDIKLLGLLEYIRRRNDKKIQKGIISKCQK